MRDMMKEEEAANYSHEVLKVKELFLSYGIASGYLILRLTPDSRAPAQHRAKVGR